MSGNQVYRFELSFLTVFGFDALDYLLLGLIFEPTNVYKGRVCRLSWFTRARKPAVKTPDLAGQCTVCTALAFFKFPRPEALTFDR